MFYVGGFSPFIRHGQFWENVMKAGDPLLEKCTYRSFQRL